MRLSALSPCLNETIRVPAAVGLSLSDMPFARPRKKSYSEDELYEYAVGALARRMRTVAELKRLMRARVEDAESEYGKTLIELIIRRLKDSGYLNDSHYAAYFSSLRRDNQKFARLEFSQRMRLGQRLESLYARL